MVVRKVIGASLVASLLSLPIRADRLDDLSRETDRLWRRGKGAEDGAFTASYGSMIAWGVGIGAAAALVAVLVKSNESGGGGHNH